MMEFATPATRRSTIICKCGVSLRLKNLPNHLNTIKHRNRMNRYSGTNLVISMFFNYEFRNAKEEKQTHEEE